MAFDIGKRQINRSVKARRRYTVDEERPIPESVLDLLTNTRRLYRVWWFTHYFIGLMGVVAGTLLTAITSSKFSDLEIFSINLTQYSWLIGIIAAVSTSLVTFLGPLHKAERYWSAYHILERACLEYSFTGQNNSKWDNLMRKVMQVHGILQVAELDRRVAKGVSNLRGAKDANVEPAREGAVG